VRLRATLDGCRKSRPAVIRSPDHAARNSLPVMEILEVVTDCQILKADVTAHTLCVILINLAVMQNVVSASVKINNFFSPTGVSGDEANRIV
jgi:hypothetical protein